MGNTNSTGNDNDSRRSLERQVVKPRGDYTSVVMKQNGDHTKVTIDFGEGKFHEDDNFKEIERVEITFSPMASNYENKNMKVLVVTSIAKGNAYKIDNIERVTFIDSQGYGPVSNQLLNIHYADDEGDVSTMSFTLNLEHDIPEETRRAHLLECFGKAMDKKEGLDFVKRKSEIDQTEKEFNEILLNPPAPPAGPPLTNESDLARTKRKFLQHFRPGSEISEYFNGDLGLEIDQYFKEKTSPRRLAESANQDSMENIFTMLWILPLLVIFVCWFKRYIVTKNNNNNVVEDNLNKDEKDPSNMV